MKADFEQLEYVFLEMSRRGEPESVVGELRQSFEDVFKAVQLSRPRMETGLRTFQFQVCSRLVDLRKSSAVVETYLQSVQRNTPTPYLLPVKSIFPDVESGLVMEIPLGGTEGVCVACSPCGRYIAAGNSDIIVIVKTSSGEILQRFRPDNGSLHVSCIVFAAGSKKIVAGSLPGEVMIWEWESSESPTKILKKHKRGVSGIAMSIDEDEIFSSSYDGSLRIWGYFYGQLKERNYPRVVLFILSHFLEMVG